MLTFVTLTTGKVVSFERRDIPDVVIDHVHNLLQQDGHLSRGWSVIVHLSTPEEAIFDILLDSVPVTYCWVCIEATVTDRLWRTATTDSKLPLVATDEQPPVPWLAVGLSGDIEDIVMKRPGRLIELPEIELAVAWTLIEHPRVN